jgi:hypothetical protein
MRFPFKHLQVAQIWLTVIVVLIAGSPYISCRCPDGRIKLFCFRSSAQPNGCCSVAPTKMSCCQGKTESSDDSSDTRSHVNRSGCSKVLNHSALVATSDSQERNPAAAELFVLVSFFDLTLASPGLAHIAHAGVDHRAPPPFDLVVTLRHLLV